MKITDNTMQALAELMDDETRESVHADLAPCSNDDFLAEYVTRDPSFARVLVREFGIDCCDLYFDCDQCPFCIGTGKYTGLGGEEYYRCCIAPQ